MEYIDFFIFWRFNYFVKDFMYFVKETRYIDMDGFIKGSIECQMNESNNQYRGHLIRGGYHSDEMVRIHKNYESQAGICGWG